MTTRRARNTVFLLAFLAKQESVNPPPAEWKISSDLNVSFSRLKNATSEPRNWLYTGTGEQLDEIVGSPGAIRALDAATGDTRWNFPIQDGSSAAGVLATAGGLVFGTGADGNLVALDSTNGKLLWKSQAGERIKSSPISYAVDGRQYVALSAGSVLFAFALPE